MKDNKFKILVWLAAAWAGMFLLTMKVKSYRLEQIDLLILFVCCGWFAYWTISTVRAYFRKETPPVNQQTPQPTEETVTHAKSKKTS